MSYSCTCSDYHCIAAALLDVCCVLAGSTRQTDQAQVVHEAGHKQYLFRALLTLKLQQHLWEVLESKSKGCISMSANLQVAAEIIH